MQGHPAYQAREADRETYKRIRAEVEAALARVENALQGGVHLVGRNVLLPLYLDEAKESLSGALRVVDRRLAGSSARLRLANRLPYSRLTH